MRRIIAIVLLGCTGLFAVHAAAQRVVAAAQAVSATQQAARLYGYSIDLRGAGVLPGAEAFPGPQPQGSLASWPGSPWALFGTETLLGDRTSALRLAPFSLRQDLRRDAPPGFRERLAGTARIDGKPHAIFIGAPEVTGSDGGYVLILPFGPALPGGFGATRLRWNVAGNPVAAVIAAVPPVLHVLYQSESGPMVASGPIAMPEFPAARHALEGPEGAAGREAGGLACSSDGRLWASIQGFSFARASGSPMTWLYTLDAATGSVLAPPAELDGVPAGASYLHPLPGDCCWVATEARGPGFYYVARVCYSGGVLAKAVEYPMRLGAGGLQLAVHQQSGFVAAAAGERLELWPGGVREDRVRSFAEPVSALAWDGVTLIAAEGNRIHQIDLVTLDSVAAASAPGGRVVSMIPVPARWAAPDADGDGLDAAQEAARASNPFNPDTDGDGLHDGSDPEPAVPSPRLELPGAIIFSGDAAGNELRTVAIAPRFGDDSGWRVRDEDDALPWLRVYPNASTGSGLLHLGVDPELYDGQAHHGALRVALEGVAPRQQAAGSPRELRVGVRAARGGVRRVLWVWATPGGDFRSAADPRGFAALAARLAAAPFYFSHVERANIAPESLAGYGLVVLSPEAAEQGGIAPGDLLDYAAAGGALLLPGTGAADRTGGIARLLAPIGLSLAVDRSVSGTYRTRSDAPLDLPPLTLAFRDAPPLSGPPDHILMPEADDAGIGAVAARDFGLGRIAVLASPSPLTGKALAQAGNQRFADALFRWLARAGTRIADDDGDGLPNALEDATGTDGTLPDTDGDGVPDGMEDRNRNGEVDEGESDPRNLDSDGDGIFDGADPRPYPALGAPRILSVSASEGPLEGGREIVITGRNLPHDARFEMGGHPAALLGNDGISTARILVPEGGAPGSVAITVAAPNGEGALASAYTYTARSVARLILEPHPDVPPVERNDRFLGILRLRAEAAEGVEFNRIILRLQAIDAPGFSWSAARPSPDLARRGIEVTSKERSGGGYEIVVNGAGKSELAPGDLVWLPWEQLTSDWNGDAIRVDAMVHPTETTPIVFVLGSRGGLLDGRLEAVSFMPNGRAIPPPRRMRETARDGVNATPDSGV